MAVFLCNARLVLESGADHLDVFLYVCARQIVRPPLPIGILTLMRPG